MHLDISKCLLIFLGSLIQFSDELECLQCTSPIRRVSRDWDHSCLDGTLMPVACPQLINKTESPFEQCVSAVHRLGRGRNSGILIYRSCTKTNMIFQECDPPNLSIDIDKTLGFYCSRTCQGDGCNRHSVKEITSNMNGLFQNQCILLHIICIIILLDIFGYIK
ncbi:hypothetical protein I4U23_008054 [Adineta vaga]|nr:hypothetical protein I4U23_008054 [Adineta vaga]